MAEIPNKISAKRDLFETLSKKNNPEPAFNTLKRTKQTAGIANLSDRLNLLEQNNAAQKYMQTLPRNMHFHQRSNIEKHKNLLTNKIESIKKSNAVSQSNVYTNTLPTPTMKHSIEEMDDNRYVSTKRYLGSTANLVSNNELSSSTCLEAREDFSLQNLLKQNAVSTPNLALHDNLSSDTRLYNPKSSYNRIDELSDDSYYIPKEPVFTSNLILNGEEHYNSHLNKQDFVINENVEQLNSMLYNKRDPPPKPKPKTKALDLDNNINFRNQNSVAYEKLVKEMNPDIHDHRNLPLKGKPTQNLAMNTDFNINFGSHEKLTHNNAMREINSATYDRKNLPPKPNRKPIPKLVLDTNTNSQKNLTSDKIMREIDSSTYDKRNLHTKLNMQPRTDLTVNSNPNFGNQKIAASNNAIMGAEFGTPIIPPKPKRKPKLNPVMDSNSEQEKTEISVYKKEHMWVLI